ncbi:hypothetical protein SISSUDRAFT_1122657 [Sistotremastrum suecicum HHB10207 ss-3]|uniref:REJ domain-containing protein n=1 Tax=Sistotremastrum suecicum HHB10207 ss-3 TaxID=1314776 RepID=A0A165Z159_9AGAM|nr:hypothetical protein SISSUDRAFT_1122657 [Sistotremastrum suecicum HHB10207 ss-3]
MLFRPLSYLVTVYAALLTLFPGVSAMITGISGDGHYAKVGYNYPITFYTQSSTQAISDYTVILGWSWIFNPSSPGGVGTFGYSTVDLISLQQVNTRAGTFTVSVPLPAAVFVINTTYTFDLTAAVTSLTGPANTPSVRLFTSQIVIEP